MEFGQYDDARREYVITTPRTPHPWINYLGTGDFTGIVSATGGGYCWHRDARLRRITRYRYNDQPADSLGRWFYVKDGDSLWSPGWAPVRAELDSWSCRHGLGYSVISAERGGLASELTVLSPVGASCELHMVVLRNRGAASKRVSLWSYAEFCLWNAWDDMTNFQRNWSTGEVQVADGGKSIMHLTEFRERRNHYAFYSCSRTPDGFDTDRAAFAGAHGSLSAPETVLAGTSRNSTAHGWAPVASQRLDLELAPGEERELVFVLGYVELHESEKFLPGGGVNRSGMDALVARYGTPGLVRAAMAELSSFWDDTLSSFRVDSGEPRLDRSLNVWNQYQCFTTFRVSRSASSFESGIGRGMGFRDSNQDIAGMAHMMPAAARLRILDLAATQLPDGSAFHQYQSLSKRGNHDIGSGFNDDPLWLVYAALAYVKETGDLAILRESVPFDNDPANAAPLLRHLGLAFSRAAGRTGPHGLPLIGRADWNDCLNLNCHSRTPDESFQTTGPADGPVAESVMIAGLVSLLGPEFAALARLAGDPGLAAEAETLTAGVERALTRHAWDGAWWKRAWDSSGKEIGSASCAEGSIFIEPQGFLAWSGLGRERGWPVTALDSVRDRLETERGLMLVQPAYRSYDPDLGEISSYPPGYKENAGIFCHSNPWIIIAEAANGRPERAWELFGKLCPAFLGDAQERHGLEPYVYSQMVAGRDAPSFGEAKNSWLTGTAAWAFVAASQWILGIRPELGGLRVDPALPPGMGGFRAERRFRGDRFLIEYLQEPGGDGSLALELDGRPIAGSLVAPPGDGGVHRVRAVRHGRTAGRMPDQGRPA